jgi:hypothetical protein
VRRPPRGVPISRGSTGTARQTGVVSKIMSRILLGIVIGAVGLFAYQRAHRAIPPSYAAELPPAVEKESNSASFRCDGRTYCSQMTSCEEANFFLENCPGVKMDGEGDGVPCERQWCGQH